MTTFRAPLINAEFVRALDRGREVDVGRIHGLVQGRQNLAHVHGINDPGHTHVVYQGWGTGSTAYPIVDYDGKQMNAAQTTTASLTGITIQSSGSIEARPRNIAYPVWINYA
ncbi:hypothetical protein [Desulfocurvibacter africanus]|uniref:hypothetical protein n=1 Tax=Desulfocurvibacter africanus TaxID=873 RepID=UPI001182A17C|nr:hypothetical protein [Desulfocurvibacter africanus]